jgi:diguanylate cyclase (GGDEF)-like protein
VDLIVTRGGSSSQEALHVATPPSQALRHFALPAVILGLAVVLAQQPPGRSETIAAIAKYGPTLVLLAGSLVTLAFKRGRALFAVLSLSAACAAFDYQLTELSPFVAKTVLAGITIFVPFNIALYSLVEERGALNAYGVRRAAVIALECLIVLTLILDNRRFLTEALYYPLFGAAPFWHEGIPQISLIVMAVALIVATTVAVTRNSTVDAAFAGAIAAFALGCNAIANPNAFFIYVAAAGGMIMVAVLQDSYRMAFHDDLTGLPGRRALNERLLALGGQYSIAMLDVDHFKSFNDRWGHDVGDQVLKLVASRLRTRERGAEAFRFGGEEFTLVFPGKRLNEVLPRLEALRRDIEQYQFSMREGPRDEEDIRSKQPPSPVSPTRALVSVSVSIGAAERNEVFIKPSEVLKAADNALYKAKGGGRNRVSY